MQRHAVLFRLMPYQTCCCRNWHIPLFSLILWLGKPPIVLSCTLSVGSSLDGIYPSLVCYCLLDTVCSLVRYYVNTALPVVECSPIIFSEGIQQCTIDTAIIIEPPVRISSRLIKSVDLLLCLFSCLILSDSVNLLSFIKTHISITGIPLCIYIFASALKWACTHNVIRIAVCSYV